MHGYTPQGPKLKTKRPAPVAQTLKNPHLGNLSMSLWVSCRKTSSGDLSGCVLENKSLNQGDSDPDSWCRA